MGILFLVVWLLCGGATVIWYLKNTSKDKLGVDELFNCILMFSVGTLGLILWCGFHLFSYIDKHPFRNPLYKPKEQ